MSFYKKLGFYLLLPIIIGVIILTLYFFGVLGPKGLTQDQIRGSNAPTDNGGSIVAKRKDNGLFQVVFSKYDVQNRKKAYIFPYNIVYNPSVSSDPAKTVFNSFDEARIWYNTTIATPAVKQYTPISTNTLETDYTNMVNINT